MRWLFADWDGNKGHVFDAVAKALTALGHDIHAIPRNDMGRRRELLNAITSGEHDVLLTWQRFYPMQKDLIEAIANSGIRTVYMDYGFEPHYHSVVFDTKGENAASQWPDLWRQDALRPEQRWLDAARELMERRAAEARSVTPPDIREIPVLRHPFVFVPLQRPSDSVVRYDSKVHDFGHLLRRVLHLTRGRFHVVCKVHPMDRDIDLGVPDVMPGQHSIIRYPNGRKNDALNQYLLSRAALVVGVNSNMLFQAIVLGTPVLATGRGWYSGSGVLHEADGLGGVDGLLGRRTLEVPDVPFEVQQRYVAACLSRQLALDELSQSDRLSDVLATIGINAGVDRVVPKPVGTNTSESVA